MRKPLALALLSASLSACVSAPGTTPAEQRPVTSTRPPPQRPDQPAPSGGAFIAPRIMNLPGLEGVIGRDATALANMFGAPRLEVKEGDAMKLQFSGQPCVLDIYLYPLRPGAQPSATHVEARRASDGEDVDRAACVRALSR